MYEKQQLLNKGTHQKYLILPTFYKNITKIHYIIEKNFSRKAKIKLKVEIYKTLYLENGLMSICGKTNTIL